MWYILLLHTFVFCSEQSKKLPYILLCRISFLLPRREDFSLSFPCSRTHRTKFPESVVKEKLQTREGGEERAGERRSWIHFPASTSPPPPSYLSTPLFGGSDEKRISNTLSSRQTQTESKDISDRIRGSDVDLASVVPTTYTTHSSVVQDGKLRYNIRGIR